MQQRRNNPANPASACCPSEQPVRSGCCIILGLLLVISAGWGCTHGQLSAKHARRQAIDLVGQGEKWEAAGQLVPAVDCYLKAIELSGRPRAYYKLAGCYVKLHDAERARLYVQQALALAPEYREAQLLGAEIEAASGLKPSEEACSGLSLVGQRETKTVADSASGSVAGSRSMRQVSSDTLRQELVVTSNSDSSGVLSEPAAQTNRLPSLEEVKKVVFPRVYAATGQTTNEEQSFWEAIEKKKGIIIDTADYHRARGEMLAQHNLFPEAEAEYQEALRLDDSELESWLGLGEIYVREQRLKKAEEHYQKIVERFPGNWRAHLVRGNFYLKMAEYEKALQDFQTAGQLEPENTKVLNNLAVAYLKLGNYEEARALLEKAVNINPQFPDPYLNLGIIYSEQLKEPAAARGFFQKYVDFKGDRAEEVEKWLGEQKK